MSVRIIVDSGSDISAERAHELDVVVLPLKLIFGTVEYRDGVDLDPHAFYEKLIESDQLPSTSQITPFQYEEAFREALATDDEVLCLTISSKLSGCYQSAFVALEALEPKLRERVAIVDTLSATIGEQVLVDLAVQLVEEGRSAVQAAEILNERRHDVKIIALLDTLEYLKRGGRVSSAVAVAGNLLSIKPVLTVSDGEVVLLGKARGSKNGNNYLNKIASKVGGIDFDAPFHLAYSGLSDVLLRKYVKDSKALYEGMASDLPVCLVGSVIGTHVGPGAIALAFFAKGK